jgi:radical SAM protein with 4Fe4S-binding SPASM domain
MENIKRIYFNIWNSCNLQCSQCFNNGGRTEGNLLTNDEIVEIVSQARDFFGIGEVQLTGGEPTNRPGIFKLIDELMHLGIHVILQTNGVFDTITRNKMLILPPEKFCLIISLDGFQTNDFFRGAKYTPITIDNIKTLASEFPLRVNCLLSEKITWEEIERLAKMASQYQFSIAFNPIIPNGRADKSVMMGRKKYFEWMYRIDAVKNDKGTIRSGYNIENNHLVEYEDCPVRRGNAIHVNCDGSVHTCGFLVNHPQMYLGSVRNTSFRNMEIKWQGNSHELLAGRCRKCEYYLNSSCHGGCPARIFALNQRYDAVDYYCMSDYFNEISD